MAGHFSRFAAAPRPDGFELRKHRVMTPLAFLARLAAIVPPLRYHVGERSDYAP
jgi:hypothetical protein